MLHRFKRTVPGWVVSAGVLVRDEYGGRAERIWAPGSHTLDVVERLRMFPGIGRKKSVMATEILRRHLGVELEGEECGQVAYDVQVRRVFLRSGLAAEDTPEAIEEAAARACPEAPGTLDLAAWLIGRETCRPRVPQCDACRLGDVCPRLTDVLVEGVGARR
jgi:endonuclease III